MNKQDNKILNVTRSFSRSDITPELPSNIPEKNNKNNYSRNELYQIRNLRECKPHSNLKNSPVANSSVCYHLETSKNVSNNHPEKIKFTKEDLQKKCSSNCIKSNADDTYENKQSNRNTSAVREKTSNDKVTLWKPSHLSANCALSPEERSRENVFRQIRSILNKLTEDKFEVLLKEVMNIKIDTYEKMNGVMLLIFEKAIDEKYFSLSYAQLCQELATVIYTNSLEKDKSNRVRYFRNVLLDKVQHEFQYIVDRNSKKEKLKPIKDEVRACKDIKKKADLLLFLADEEGKFRRRAVGTVRFIGELFLANMLTVNIVGRCINSLIEEYSEDKLECLCTLLKTVGKKFEESQIVGGKNLTLEKIISEMQKIIDHSNRANSSKKISKRVCFMLQDTMDLRSNNWFITPLPQPLEQIGQNFER